MKKKILILGGSGFIADNFSKTMKHKYQIFKTHHKNARKNSIFFDVRKSSINKLMNVKNKPDVVIYAAGISNHTYCAKNKTQSRYINVTANTKQILNIINKKIKIIFLSTQMVYSGYKGNYIEKDKPLPLLEYSKHKLDVEKFIKKKTKNYLILRLSKIIGLAKNKKDPIHFFLNDLNKNLNVKLADDQVSNYLYIDDLNKILEEAIDNNICGIFNIGGAKSVSRYKFFYNFLKKYNLSKIKKLKKCKINEINFYEKQPKDTSFKLAKFKKFFKTRPKSYKEFNKIILKNLKI